MLLTAYQSRQFFILLSLVRMLTEPIKPYKKQSIAILFLLIRYTNQQNRTLSYTKLACDTTDCRLFILLTPRVVTRFMERWKICGCGIFLFADFMQRIYLLQTKHCWFTSIFSQSAFFHHLSLQHADGMSTAIKQVDRNWHSEVCI